MTDVTQYRVRRDGAIRVPDKLMEEVGLYPESRITIRIVDGRIVIAKAAMADDPFAAAAKGPDTSKIEKIQEKWREDKEKAKDQFEELLKNPPEIKPEDNPDLWR
jgi:antitoxin component of MazEF toxin-antitoxin module